MTDPILKLAIFFFVGVGMAAVPVLLSFLLWRKRDNRIQDTRYKIQDTSREFEPYESGMAPVGSGHAVGFEYLMYAMLFLLFDVIAILAFLGVLALRHDRAGYAWGFLALVGLSLVIIAYGVKKRTYVNI